MNAYQDILVDVVEIVLHHDVLHASVRISIRGRV